MSKINVKKSIYIESSPSKVYEAISDFNQWGVWSPWLIMEDNTKVNVSDDNKFYEWNGDITGAGNITKIKEQKEQQIDYDLLFLKPWKSKAKTSFHLAPEGKGTTLTWTMNSQLPFFLFWMKKVTEIFIGMDYNRGLTMIKDYVEDGKVHSKMDFNGETTFDGGKYIAIQTECSIGDISKNSKQDFEKLMSYMRENHGDIIGKPMSIYHKWDLKNQIVNYSACVLVSEYPPSIPNDFITGSYPSTKVYKVTHIGPYRHIGNAWTATMMRQRAKHFKTNKKLSPLEFYVNNPNNTSSELELITEVLFPIV